MRNNIPCYAAETIIRDDFRDVFFVTTQYWMLEDYQQQWCAAIQRLNDYNTACLVTFIVGPKRGGATLYPLYREGDTIFMQDHMYTGKDFKKIVGKNPFNPETCYQYVEPHNRFTDCGRKVSEWSIPFSDMLQALPTMQENVLRGVQATLKYQSLSKKYQRKQAIHEIK